MLGAIVGDIIGSPYEYRPIKTTEFPLFQEDSIFTDDSVMTLATALAILEGQDYDLPGTGSPLSKRGLRLPFSALAVFRGRRTLQFLGKRVGHAGEPGGVGL